MNRVSSVALLEQDYSFILGFSLSILREKLITNCYAGKRFRSHSALKNILDILLDSKAANTNVAIETALRSLQAGLLAIMSRTGVDSIDGRQHLHEHFINAYAVAHNVEGNFMVKGKLSDRELLEGFESNLIAFKIQIIYAFYQELEADWNGTDPNPRNGLQREDPLTVLNRLMASSYSSQVIKAIATKQKGKGKLELKFASFDESQQIHAAIFLSLASVDRITQTYANGKPFSACLLSNPDVSYHPYAFQLPLTLASGSKSVLKVLATEKFTSIDASSLEEVEQIEIVPESSFGWYDSLNSSMLSSCQRSLKIESLKLKTCAVQRDWLMLGYACGKIQVYDINKVLLLATTTSEGGVEALTSDFHKGKIFYADTDGGLFEWDPLDNKRQRALSNQINTKSKITCLVTDDGVHSKLVKYLVSGHENGNIDVWNLLSDQATILFSIVSAHKSMITALRVRSAEVFSAGADKKIKTWDIGRRSFLSSVESHSVVSSLLVDRDIVLSGAGRHITVYNRQTLKKVLRCQLTGSLTNMYVDSNRQLYTSATTIRRWSLESIAERMKAIEQRNRMRKKNRERTPRKSRKNSASQAIEIGNIFQVLNDPRLRTKFMAFLKHSYAEENLSFWIVVQRYKELFEQDNCNPRALGELGKEIVAEFIHEDGHSSVNVVSDIREELTVLSEHDFTTSTFDEAERAIVFLMDSNFFNVFSLQLTNGSDASSTSTYESNTMSSFSFYL